MNDDHETLWHMKLSIAGLVTLFIQTATLVWWGASLTKAVEDHEKRITQLEAWRDNKDKSATDLAVLKVQVEGMMTRMTFLERGGYAPLFIQPPPDQSQKKMSRP